MIMYLRYWLDQININVENTFKFNGYLITVLVISFFQINHLLPSVCTLQTNIKKVNSGSKLSSEKKERKSKVYYAF